MLALVIAIFAASVFGSLHCAGMCGTFLAIALGDGVSRWKTQAAYHLGRLVTYAALGAIAGAAGGVINLAGALAGIKPVATSIAGATMLLFGLTSLLRIMGVRTSRLSPPAFVRSISNRGYALAMRQGMTARAATIGLLTTLLPCGWLYAFVGTAAGTASVGWGSVAMAVFWAGTLPMMVSLGVGIRGLAGALGSRVPAITCVAMMAMGLVTLAGRANLDPVSLMARATGRPTAPAVPDAKVKPACCEKGEVQR